MKQSNNLKQFSFISHGFCNCQDSSSVPAPILMNQVHSADVLFLTEHPLTPPAVDALITKTKGLCLTVKTADCAPVLLVDKTSKMVAAIHAGWKGAFQGVLENTVLQMIRHGANLDTIYASIGPHIQKKSFICGEDMQNLFPVTEKRFFVQNDDQNYFDFDAYVRYRLERIGIQYIESVTDDTYTDTDYFSYRRNPTDPGRQYSFIIIKEE